MAKPLVELEYIDPSLVHGSSDSADQAVAGNLVLETQQDMVSGKTTVYETASFYEPIAKNVLFDKTKTNALDKNIYKPKPTEEPCGIPGYPDCPGAVVPPTVPVSPSQPPPPSTNPEEPCGIPGFPECPKPK